MQLKASLEFTGNKPVILVLFRFKLLVNLFLFQLHCGFTIFLFLSYQDPIPVDFSAVETALFNVKMTSNLADWPNFDKMKPFSDWSFGYFFYMTF